MITDPYRPPVWAMSSNDTPLVVESDQKFPTGSATHVRIELYDASKRQNADKSQAHIKIPLTKLRNLSISSGRWVQLPSDFERKG